MKAVQFLAQHLGQRMREMFIWGAISGFIGLFVGILKNV